MEGEAARAPKQVRLRIESIDRPLAGTELVTQQTMIQIDIYCGLITGDDATTVDANRKVITDLALAAFPNGHTLIDAQGRWDQGNVPITEPTTIVRLILDEADEHKAHRLAGLYKEAAKQESVMIIKTNIDASFV